ncbi:neutral/alkaline non-lysosomal ceramidase N-terminal domain-containing protein [Microbulbifer sp. TYP-18]|uniref:neutral/alkaline non-lysosomal ceramidase N-terminal domain-containing protein n=1 Tax=Microbulbifer sp. TYP-18 TaxID=3230024 RepID=UPI0034C6A880
MKLLGVLIFGMLLSLNVSATYFVGYGKADITPTNSEALASCMGGYGSLFFRCGSSEILDAISVRAFSVSDLDTHALYIVVDTVGLGDTLMAEVRNGITQATFNLVKPEYIHLAATHTHAGPDLQGLWGGVSVEYRQRIVSEMVRAGIEAIQYTSPGILKVGTTEIPVTNRRGWNEVDNSLRVLYFEPFLDKYFRPITLINASAHPTILDETNLGYSAGYVNALRKVVEAGTEGNAIFINGIVGDATPSVDAADYAAVSEYGAMLGNKALEANYSADIVYGDFQMVSTSVTHPVSNTGFVQLQHTGHLDVNLAPDNTISAPLAYFKFGNKVEGLHWPGEALTRLGLPLLDRLIASHKLFFGLTDASYGYFLPIDEFLQVPGRTTEENANLDPMIGDAAKAAMISLLSEE